MPCVARAGAPGRRAASVGRQSGGPPRGASNRSSPGGLPLGRPGPYPVDARKGTPRPTGSCCRPGRDGGLLVILRAYDPGSMGTATVASRGTSGFGDVDVVVVG